MISKIIRTGDPEHPDCIAVDTALDQLQAINKKVNILRANVEENGLLFAEYHVKSLPTLIFIDENNNEVDRHMGPISIQDLIKKLN